MLEAANRVLSNLDRSFDTSKRCKRKAKDEMQSLFKGKRSKTPAKAWKHVFVCLAYCHQTRVPTTDVEKDDLLKAGLGEKEICFNDLEIGAEEFRQVMHEHYPSLQNSGDFEFFKCVPNSRTLEKLSSSCLSSPSMLKRRVGSAKTYIKPIQKDLSMTAVFDLPGGVRPSI